MPSRSKKHYVIKHMPLTEEELRAALNILYEAAKPERKAAEAEKAAARAEEERQIAAGNGNVCIEKAQAAVRNERRRMRSRMSIIEIDAAEAEKEREQAEAIKTAGAKTDEERKAWMKICRAFVRVAYAAAYRYEWRTMEPDDAVGEWAHWIYYQIRECYSSDLNIPATVYVYNQTKWFMAGLFQKKEQKCVETTVDGPKGPITGKIYIRKPAAPPVNTEDDIKEIFSAGLEPENAFLPAPKNSEWLRDARMTISIIQRHLENGNYRSDKSWTGVPYKASTLLIMETFLSMQNPTAHKVGKLLNIDSHAVEDRFAGIKEDAENLMKVKSLKAAFLLNMRELGLITARCAQY